MAAAVNTYFSRREWPDPAGLELTREERCGACGVPKEHHSQRVMDEYEPEERWVSVWREVQE